jgi:phospholipid/cholesterol/gamma-HCH transport system permease protein
MFSEIGPIMTAIILAGRSGSAMTAELSTMVVLEEVKALRTMGISPIQYLIQPRFIAFSITVPLLTYLAVLSGIFAGFLIAFFYLHLPPEMFASELAEGVPISLLWQCGVKALVFAWIITLVASLKGLGARGGADAVGKATTSCVVFSISAIIVVDALFSFLFYW